MGFLSFYGNDAVTYTSINQSMCGWPDRILSCHIAMCHLHWSLSCHGNDIVSPFLSQKCVTYMWILSCPGNLSLMCESFPVMVMCHLHVIPFMCRFQQWFVLIYSSELMLGNDHGKFLLMIHQLVRRSRSSLPWYTFPLYISTVNKKVIRI